MKKILSAVLTLIALGGCNSVPEGVSPLPQNTQSEQMGMSDFDITSETETFTNECDISLGENVNINGEGALIDNNCITINESGVYTVTGEMSNGIIYVECKETVKLILNNAIISNDNGAAIISESEKLIIECEEGTENTLRDGKEYTYSRSFENEEKHESALYTEGELVFTGKGILNIYGKNSEGITASQLSAKGILRVTAEDNGIIADNGISSSGAQISLVSEKDGMKTDGDISLFDSSITIAAENDGIQAEGVVAAANTIFDISTTGNIEEEPELSSKGIKAGRITFSACDITVKSTDHSVKSDESVEITGGRLTLSSSMGKGITADGALTLGGAEIVVSDSEEGIESKSTLTINGGSLNITSSDDGINTGGDDLTADHSIVINSGTVIVNAGGDGLDSNGNITINGGTVVVFGPVSDGNTPLDWGEMGFSLTVTGGKVLAVGSTGMMMNPGADFFTSSSLNAQAGDVITVADESGNVILSAATPKAAQGVIFGGVANCRAYKNGTVNGKADENGIVTSGTVTGGTEITAGMSRGAGGFGGRGGGKRKEGEIPTGNPEKNNIPPALPDGDMSPMNDTTQM